MAEIFRTIVLIFSVLMIFNVIIFVHELGHFLAGKWRGLKIDRFQIWFGKPIWKMNYRGVQYGLGWIPAGGFVSLPQMAPMESIEGKTDGAENLPPIKPLDKIIVAAAGPLFSLLLAFSAAFVVWKVGKPADFIPSTEIGFVLPDSPAAKAGLRMGDKVLAINGDPVDGFAGSLDSVTERIILSRGDKIEFTVERPGEASPLKLVSGFETESSRWFQRRGVRQVGIHYRQTLMIGEVLPNSPAAKAGLAKGDTAVSIDGQKLYSMPQLPAYLLTKKGEPIVLGVNNSAGQFREVTLTPKSPLQPKGVDPMLGIVWESGDKEVTKIVYPNPLKQIGDSARMMWTTITGVIAPDSGIGIQHLSGPVGIGTVQFQMLQTELGWHRILAFMVLFNVNLAILNMLPFPVLDGGHITLAILEKIAKRPVHARPLEFIQTACALALMSLMLYITTKDIGDKFGRGGPSSREETIFSPD